MKQRNLAIILIPVFILTILWVIFNIYHNYISSTITDPLSYQIIPIQGSFDKKIIEEIRQRKRINPVNEIIVTNQASSTPRLEIINQEASPSAETELELLQAEEE
jgi:hypothetical protein